MAAAVVGSERTEAEVLDLRCQRGFVEHDLRGGRGAFAAVRVPSRPATPYAVLAAFRIAPLVIPVAVLRRHAGLVLLLAAAHFAEDRLHQGFVRRHCRLEVAVLRFEIGDDVLVIDGGVAVVAQPMPRVLHGDAVVGERVRLGLRLGRLGKRGMGGDGCLRT